MRTVVLLPLALLAAGCGPRALAEPPEPAPVPRPVATVRSSYPPPPPEACRCITICFVRDGRLTELPAAWHIQRGVMMTRDSLPITEIAPLTGEYASVAGWYVNDEPLVFRSRPYIKYGLPRVLGISEVERAGEYDGVPVFIEARDTTSVPVLYLPVRPGCEFHPYMPVATR
jgi:hypothetical protein